MTLLEILLLVPAAQSGGSRIIWDDDLALYAYEVGRTHLAWLSFDELPGQVGETFDPTWSVLSTQQVLKGCTHVVHE